jgi:SHS2 domain-containing protein
MTGYEILEHTADVGVRAAAATIEEVFEQATLGMLEITGALGEGEGAAHVISVQGRDLGAILVGWLEEVLYLQDAKDNVIVGIEVAGVGDEGAQGTVWVKAREGSLEGTAVKAVTYHQLSIEPADDGWVAQVYFDI